MRRRHIRVIGLGALASLLLVVIGFLVWANSPYRADRSATLDVFRNGDISVTSVDEGILMTPGGDAVDLPAGSVGLVFVPGARVEPYAYMYQLSGVVEQYGVTVLITRPTLNLAFFDLRELDDFTTADPGIERWYVGGHSLGGVRACLLAAEAKLEGIVLVGSYCANDLSDSRLGALSIAGENDGVSDLATVEAGLSLLPDDAEFVVIEGANHASFGDYGPQAGDGERSIAREQMREELTALLGAFLR